MIVAIVIPAYNEAATIAGVVDSVSPHGMPIVVDDCSTDDTGTYALAAGADACSIGRAYLYGLSAGGEAGVERCLTIFKTELERTLTLLGVRSLAEIRPEHLTRIQTHEQATRANS